MSEMRNHDKAGDRCLEIEPKGNSRGRRDGMITKEEAKRALKMLVNDIRNQDEKLFGKENMTANHITWVGTLFEYLGDEVEAPKSPPAEYPEIRAYASGQGPLDTAPILTGTCIRWGNVVGKKPAQSCKGCTVTCPAKNKYAGEPMEIKS
jgi:hypothetical protein